MLKKLFTILVEDGFSSHTSDLLQAAKEAANEYFVIYNWSEISVSKSTLPSKKIGNVTIHYFDVFGKGDVIDFFDPYDDSANLEDR